MRRFTAWRSAAPAFGETELEASKDMKVVTRIGVGYDAVDVPALSRRKVPLMVAGTANSPSVAEQALFMMLTLAKRATEMHACVKDGKWANRLGMLPFDLYGKTVLIIGFGRIGTRTAKRCLAMEMKVLVYDPYKPAAEIKAAGCEPVADLDAALPQCRLRHHPLPEDAGDGRPVRCGADRPDEADVLSDQHRARRHRRRRPRCTTRWCPASSPVPASTCSKRSRRRSAMRCSRCPTSSWPRTSPASRVEAVEPHERADRAQHPERARRRSDPAEHHQSGRARLSAIRRRPIGRLRKARMRPISVQIGPQLSLNQTRVMCPAAAAVGRLAGRVELEDGPLSEIDPTDQALATIASIFEHPEPVLVVRDTRPKRGCDEDAVARRASDLRRACLTL